jgi:outer membrane protein assembly factor BamB
MSNAIVAYDLLSGARVWRSQLLLNSSQEILCASDGFVFLANATIVPGQTNDGPTNGAFNVLALDAATGAQRWLRAFASDTLSSATTPETIKSVYCAAETIVVIMRDSVYALRERDGADMWKKTLTTPAFPPGEMIFDAATDASSVYLLTSDLGPTSDTPTTLTRASATVARDTLLALDARTGVQRWRAEIAVADQLQVTWRGDIWMNSPALALSSGALLVGSQVPPGYGWNLNHQPQTTSGLVAYDAATGRRLWQDEAMRTGVAWNLTPLSSPLAADGAIYLLGAGASPYPAEFSLFSTGALWLYAVNIHTGAGWWRVRVG